MTKFLSAAAVFALIGACWSLYEHEICMQLPLIGACQMYRRMYYFDVQSNRCEEFVYSGCGGTENRFITEEDCLQTCQYLMGVIYPEINRSENLRGEWPVEPSDLYSTE